MKIHRAIAPVVLAAVLAPCRAADVYVVSGPNVALSPDEVRQVFLGDKQFAGNTKLNPVENAALQGEFQAKALKVDAARYNSIWAKKGFREGLTQPAVRTSDADVIAAIKANPGTIGYVSKPTADVKVIEKL